MRLAIPFLLILMSCVSSSIELGNEPADAGPREDVRLDAVQADASEEDVPVAVECTRATECVLTSECCPGCGPARGDIVSRPRSMDLAAIPPICEDVFCEECLEEYSDPTLIPDCVDGYCTFIDLLDIGDLNQCDSNGSGEECVVRAGPCCECGVDIFEENLVSINEDKVRRYVQHVCDGTESCEECVPDYEAAGFGPACEARPGSDQGRCTFIGL